MEISNKGVSGEASDTPKGVFTLVDLAGFKFPNNEKLTKADIAQHKIDKELSSSLFAIKKLIMKLPLSNELTIEQDKVLIDLISQNLRTDYKIYVMGHIKGSKECMETLYFCNLFRSIVDEYLAIKATEQKPDHTTSNMLQELRAEVDNEVSISKRSLYSAKIEERKDNKVSIPQEIPKDVVNKITHFEQISSINSISSRNVSSSKLFDDPFLRRPKVSELNNKTVKRNVAETKKNALMFKTMKVKNNKEEYNKLVNIIKINKNSKHYISTKTIPHQMQTSKIDNAPKSQPINKLELSTGPIGSLKARGKSHRSVEHSASYDKQNNALKNAGIQIAIQSISSIKSSFKQIFNNCVQHKASCFSYTKTSSKIHNLTNPPEVIKYIFIPVKSKDDLKEVQSVGKKLKLSKLALKTVSTSQKASDNMIHVKSCNLLHN